jgi:uncharacterized membrane protein YeaQ/YmgE (transglycosylase-associated protein family)
VIDLVVILVTAGIVAGAVSPLVVPGRRHMPVVVTMLLGILGSFTGGVLGYLLVGRDAGVVGSVQPAWVVGAVVGAVVAQALFIAFGRRPEQSRRPRSGSRASEGRRQEHM